MEVLPLIVSAGVDGDTGLLEPHELTGLGYLAMPKPQVLVDPGNSPMADNVTN